MSEDKRLVDMTAGELKALIDERLAEVLARTQRTAAKPLVDSLEAGRMLGIRQRSEPGPEPADRDSPAWADWARRRQAADTAMRKAVWARACGPKADPALGRLVRRRGDAIYFLRAELEAYINGLGLRSCGRGGGASVSER